ncbi:MAG: hypothetical protein D6B27_02755 [Gammaproteobacteria bacterium]|nr:MAG: hypothetical protein D6B27_02755 [Gammaproteobacteria bacterium]
MLKTKTGKNAISIIVIIALTFVVTDILMPHGAATTPDSINYLDISYNLSKGYGFGKTDYSLTAYLNKNDSHQTLIERSWPPLYPLFLSVFVKSPSDTESVKTASFLLLIIAVTLIFLTLRIHFEWHISSLLSLSFIFSLPLLTIFTFAWSETLFIALLAASIYIAISMFNSPKLFAIKLSLLFALAALLFYTRYIGICFISIPLLVQIIQRKKITAKLIILNLALLAVYSIVVGALMYSNFQYTNSITGAIRPESKNGFFQNLLFALDAFKITVPENIITLLIATIISIVFSYALTQKNNASNTPSEIPMLKPIIFSAILSTIYLLTVLISGAIKTFDQIDIRLISPSFILLLLALALTLKLNSSKIYSLCLKTFSVLTLVLLAINGLTTFIETQNNWSKGNQPMLKKTTKLYYVNNSPSKKEIHIYKELFIRLTKEKGLIITNTPQTMRFFSDLDIFLSLPIEINNKNINQINSLPKGSKIFIPKSYNLNINKELGEIQLIAIDMKSHMAIHLPLERKKTDMFL